MELLLILLVVIIALIGTALLLRRLKAGSASQMTLEEKLAILASCGLKLAEPFTVDNLLSSWGRDELEAPGFDLVLVGLGMTEEQEPWRNHCINLWHFDTECIEDHGSYSRIVERMSEMSQGAMVLDNIKDYVDLEEEVAWFSFSFQDMEIKVSCKVEDDWVDTSVFSTFIDLLANADPSKIFIYYNLGGQDCLIGCISKDELNALNSHGIKFEPLT